MYAVFQGQAKHFVRGERYRSYWNSFPLLFISGTLQCLPSSPINSRFGWKCRAYSLFLPKSPCHHWKACNLPIKNGWGLSVLKLLVAQSPRITINEDNFTSDLSRAGQWLFKEANRSLPLPQESVALMAEWLTVQGFELLGLVTLPLLVRETATSEAVYKRGRPTPSHKKTFMFWYIGVKLVYRNI